jgi:ketosteroid isomerase-like protein
MKNVPALFLIIITQLLITPLQANAQNDKDEILRIRNESNAALKNFDNELYLTLLTDRVQYTISNGTLIQGKENLKKFISQATDPKMYWVRTPNEIDVNTRLGLAWEAGTWRGYTLDSGQKSVTGGKYSAQWIKVNGEWKINSQLFVKLE